ncbi:diguanylate cyclase/phosphodiesterase (GGDEF & EAL domains) with PAS/PAC sensor(s) [uncultured Synechococcales cyanobacterium]|uniref:Diguanylate cyclase/phosphodiesterase (GGDEF & EAL domains) with PAS/PAC sensor(S) n=1 Tax=uncultured Synechococcales cyanobacterium TaxID=1936017 RepID=A0A6J4V945_9CYAN|nr:diguanylate cyclase/phosphodiesterase (GGDEF & EAL domains) with PAS/PAC sensor(s) [uncultured Synechococcales cyanobacterium]
MTMTLSVPLKILLVEDDEDDYLITQELIQEIIEAGQSASVAPQFELEWVKTCESALEALSQNRHDVILLDYRLGAYTGLDILRKSAAAGYPTPTIILVGSGSYETDCMASELGAAGYLDKDQVSSRVLERSLRYAVTYALKHQKKTSFTQELQILRAINQNVNELE